MNSHLDDRILVREYLEGKEAALEKLIKKHQERVYSYIHLIVKDEFIANDIFQDTFIKVVNTLKNGRYNEEGKFIQWVLRIAHNLSIDHFRNLKRMPMQRGTEEFDIFDTLGLEDENMEEKMIYGQIQKDVVKLLELLPEEQRTVLRMRIFCEMSFKEIAEETNVSINTALGRMRYALINLRKLVKNKNIQLTNS
ncbi:sigma-70 family RNA polymerase sigma factor [bacterium SCSIO 12741]|nr:sigma-70 family RNA polymerase sigma factor [bacterium SCSIO 12741]